MPYDPSATKPGALDDQKFVQDWSVELWRNFRIPADIKNENLPASTRYVGLTKGHMAMLYGRKALSMSFLNKSRSIALCYTAQHAI